MSDPPLARRLRRSVTIPGVVLGATLALAASPLALPLCAALDLARRRRALPLTRAAAFVGLALCCEALGVTTALLLGLTWPLSARATYLDRHRRLQRAWCHALLGGLRGVFGLRLEVEGEEQVGQGPLLVFSRHTSLVDTLLPVEVLGRGHGLRLRYVLKRALLWDPCLDLVGQRLPNAFVRRGGERTGEDVDAVRRLAQDLGPDDGVLLYPEGTRFSPARREAAIQELLAAGREVHAARARALTHVLPPRVAGPLALLAAAPQADVLLIAHDGLDGAASLSDLARGELVRARVRVKMWRVPRGEVPCAPEARIDWLYDQWALLDAWVAEQRARRD